MQASTDIERGSGGVQVFDRIPNAVIVGAPRCGSTSLFEWLNEHPEVSGSNVKETYYLMDRGATVPDGPRYFDDGMEGYAQFFKDGRGEAPVVLEATPGYFYQQTALDVLGSHIPDARLIAILRRPADRVLSSYHYFSNNWTDLNPDRVSFSAYLELARNEDASLANNDFLRYVLSHGRYVEHLRRWSRVCGRERIHIVLLEEFQRDPVGVMQDLARWLEIDPAFYDDYAFRRENENYRVRSHTLQRLNQSIRGIIPDGALRRFAKAAYRKMNTRKSGGVTANERDALRELDEEYREWNVLLAREFDLDLSLWERPR